MNLADQEHDPDSLWSFMRRLIGIRRKRPELGWGEFAVIEQPAPTVLAHRLALSGAAVVAVHNFSADPSTVSLAGVLEPDDLVDDLLVGESVAHDGDLELNLGGYGFCWLWVRPAANTST